MLLEAWTVEYKGKERRGRKPDQWIECRIVRMYHGTVYGGSNGTGRTVEEARLSAVLGLARAICDDPSAFKHDAEAILMGEQLRWWENKLHELHESLEFGEEVTGSEKKLRRRIKLLEQLQAEWQEDHDYWPEKAQDSSQAEHKAEGQATPGKAFAASARAAAASLSAAAAAVQAARADT